MVDGTLLLLTIFHLDLFKFIIFIFSLRQTDIALRLPLEHPVVIFLNCSKINAQFMICFVHPVRETSSYTCRRARNVWMC